MIQQPSERLYRALLDRLEHLYSLRVPLRVRVSDRRTPSERWAPILLELLARRPTSAAGSSTGKACPASA